MTDERTQWLFRDDFRQDHVIRRVVHLRTGGGQAGSVGRVDVASPLLIGRAGLSIGFDRDRLEFHAVRFEVVGKVQFGGSAGLDADAGAAQFLGALHAQVFADHEPLAVVVVDANELEAKIHVPAKGPGRVPGQHVDLAGSEGREARLAGRRGELDLRFIAENRNGYGAAHVDVEPGPLAFVVRRGKTD